MIDVIHINLIPIFELFKPFSVLALNKYNSEEEKVLILISSLMAWDATPKKLQEIKEPG